VVGLCPRPRIAVNLLGRVIAPPPLPKTRSGSEEDLPMRTYVTPLCSVHGARCDIFITSLIVVCSQPDRASKRSSREKGREDRSRRTSDKEKDHERTRDSDRRRRDREEDASDGRQAPPEKVR
jgi:hypothetical protein